MTFFPTPKSKPQQKKSYYLPLHRISWWAPQAPADWAGWQRSPSTRHRAAGYLRPSAARSWQSDRPWPPEAAVWCHPALPHPSASIAKEGRRGIENRYELDLASVQGQSNPIGVSYGQRSDELRRYERGFGEGGGGGRKRDIFPRLPICSSIDRREKGGGRLVSEALINTVPSSSPLYRSPHALYNYITALHIVTCSGYQENVIIGSK